MIINGQTLLKYAPIVNMENKKIKKYGVSYGLSEAGYDIRIKQDIVFTPNNWVKIYYPYDDDEMMSSEKVQIGNFCLASSIEKFDMPTNLVGTVKDKSTWARKGLSVFNTVIEPGWKGYLTLELVYHGADSLHIPAGSGIAQVLFSSIKEEATYGDGKYQNAEDRPQEALN